MNCYDKQNNLIQGSLISSPVAYPNRGIFRDDADNLFLVEICKNHMVLVSDKISRDKAFNVAENCIAGVPIQGSANGAMNAMAVTMIAVVCEYERIIASFEENQTH